jgi:hypothetical protein
MLAAVTGTADRGAWERLAVEYAESGLRIWAEAEPTLMPATALTSSFQASNVTLTATGGR